ncbi:uncharacterized protein LOC120112438 isoform X2 [Phoenix dactylifera]|uniref:Uncharacterized protein LOC120112438 isoform X2 n=1 Tax=Phoenix dactylifera TaxID=42345 RepID=A0A8B9AQK4_PHODC|nr:uncharacterized protein LOC120112438 isoform X2 [Phoenix dactylifera]
MGDINSITELLLLYEILRHQLSTVRLVDVDKIRETNLYRENRDETDGSQEECFDPIGQAPVNSAEGYWCYTRLFYDRKGKPIRKVPVGKGSWNLRLTESMESGDGKKWCKRKLKYDKNEVDTLKFKMTQYSLGGKDDKPSYAICQISRSTDTAAAFQGAAGDSRPPGIGQRDLFQNDVVPPDNSTLQGDIAGESNDILQGPQIIPPYAVHPSQNYAPSMIHPPSIYENLTKKRKFLEIRDPSDGTSWPIEDDRMIGFLKMFKSAPGQSTHEIRQPNSASPYIGTEDNQCTFPNETAMHQDRYLSHQSFMPNQESLLADNPYQQTLLPTTTTIFRSEGEANHGDGHFTSYRPLDENQQAYQRNIAYPIDPFYTPGESSTGHSQIFSADNVPTSVANSNLFQGTDDPVKELEQRQGFLPD